MTKDSKYLQRKMADQAQIAYGKVMMARYQEELSHIVTDEEALTFKERWGKIADALADGWILDFESVDILKGIG